MAETIKLNLDLGLQTIEITENFSITFNPTDPNFAKKLFNVFDELEKKQGERKEIAKSDSSLESLFDEYTKLDDEMRELIDGVLGETASDNIFGDMNVYALNTEGIPLWTAVLLEIMSIVSESFEKGTQGDISQKLEKYIGRYTKKPASRK